MRDRVRLTAADGSPLGIVEKSDGLGVRWAEVRPARDADPRAVAAAVVAVVPGARAVVTDDELVTALVDLGGTVQRRAHDYAYDLRDVPPDWRAATFPPGYTPADVAEPDELAPARRAAYPPGHPDHDPADDHPAQLRALIGGEVLGPFVPDVSLVVRQDAAVVGALLVVDRPAFAGTPAGLWLVDVFVDPAHAGRGIGRRMLQRSVARAATTGHSRMGLVVSDGNPARRLYESLGFRVVVSGTNVDLPGSGGDRPLRPRGPT